MYLFRILHMFFIGVFRYIILSYIFVFQLTSNYFIIFFSCYIVVIDYVYANTILLRFFFHYFIVAQNGGTWVKEEAVLGSTFIFKKFDISINIGKLVKNLCNYASLLLLFLVKLVALKRAIFYVSFPGNTEVFKYFLNH